MDAGGGHLERTIVGASPRVDQGDLGAGVGPRDTGGSREQMGMTAMGVPTAESSQETEVV